jgi:hypothetical protein
MIYGVGLLALVVLSVVLSRLGGDPHMLQAQGGPFAILAAAWLLLSGGKNKAGQKIDPCNPQAIQQSLAAGAKGAVGGAATGSAAGPYGAAAVGGVQGILGASAAIGCGIAQLNAAKNKLCDNATAVGNEMASKGFALPAGFSGWSCDQKIAFIAIMGPFGIPILLAGALVNGAIAGLSEEISKAGEALATFNDDVNHALGQVGAGVEHAAQQAGNVASGSDYVQNPFGGGGFNV